MTGGYQISPTFTSHEDLETQVAIFTFFFSTILRIPGPEPFRNSGVNAASPHIRSPAFDGCTTIPHARGRLGRMRPILSAACFSQPRSRFILPDPTRLAEPRGLRNSLPVSSGRLQRRSFRYLAVDRESPKRNEEFACERHYGDAAKATTISLDPLMEPPAQCRFRLVSEP